MERFKDGRKILAFGAGYRALLDARLKTTTVRLTYPRSYKWSGDESVYLRTRSAPDIPAKITRARTMRFGDLRKADLKHESPDSMTINALRCVLGNAYKCNVGDGDYITVLDFRYE